MSDTEETIVELSKVKLSLITIGSFAFVAIGIWMLGLENQTVEGSRFTEPDYVNGVAMAAIAFFGVCGIFGLKKMSDHRPGVLLTPDGFYDNSSGVAAGIVTWSDVSGVSEYSMQGQRFVSVLLKDPETYVNRGSTLRRMANRANMKLCGTPVNISANSLKISYEELLKLFETYLESSRAGSGEGVSGDPDSPA
jgi:hypothetical protein